MVRGIKRRAARTRMMDDGQLAVGLFYFDLGRRRLDAEDIVVGRIDNHTEGVLQSKNRMCFAARRLLQHKNEKVNIFFRGACNLFAMVPVRIWNTPPIADYRSKLINVPFSAGSAGHKDRQAFLFENKQVRREREVSRSVLKYLRYCRQIVTRDRYLIPTWISRPTTR